MEATICLSVCSLSVLISGQENELTVLFGCGLTRWVNLGHCRIEELDLFDATVFEAELAQYIAFSEDC